MSNPPGDPGPTSEAAGHGPRTANSLPYLTADLPGTGGRYKVHPEDFQVAEIPLYPASGSGTHVYFEVIKKSRTTMGAASVIAKALGRRSGEIGFAGLKDSHAVTRQWMSLEHVEPQRIERLRLAGIEIGRISRHTNKLRTGHVAGNRFDLKVRQAAPDAAARAAAILAVLGRRGVPNYFGSQRFGMRGDGWLCGRHLLLDQAEPFCAQFVGRPTSGETPEILEARRAFDDGRCRDALALWPPRHRDERRVLAVLAQGKTARRAMRSIDKYLRRFLISAFQSHLFNLVLAGRIERLDRMQAGDLAYRHGHGAVFRVLDAAVEQSRADAFEISPTGPLFGYRMTWPDGEPRAAEEQVLADAGLTPESFRDPGRIRVKGGRRPLRFQPTDVSVSEGADDWGPFLRLQFALPSGCYATVLLEEILKCRVVPEPGEDLELD